MRDDQLKAFDVFLREWCEQRGWPYRPEGNMNISDNATCKYCGHRASVHDENGACVYIDSEAPCMCQQFVADTKDYWADVEGTDEHEMAQFDRAIEEE